MQFGDDYCNSEAVSDGDITYFIGIFAAHDIS
jgi:hypothetical protein